MLVLFLEIVVDLILVWSWSLSLFWSSLCSDLVHGLGMVMIMVLVRILVALIIFVTFLVRVRVLSW